jgi:hypothetical protein
MKNGRTRRRLRGETMHGERSFERKLTEARNEAVAMTS